MPEKDRLGHALADRVNKRHKQRHDKAMTAMKKLANSWVVPLLHSCFTRMCVHGSKKSALKRVFNRRANFDADSAQSQCAKCLRRILFSALQDEFCPIAQNSSVSAKAISGGPGTNGKGSNSFWPGQEVQDRPFQTSLRYNSACVAVLGHANSASERGC